MKHLDFEGTNEITGTINDRRFGEQLTSLALRNLPHIGGFEHIPPKLQSITLDNVYIESPVPFKKYLHYKYTIFLSYRRYPVQFRTG